MLISGEGRLGVELLLDVREYRDGSDKIEYAWLTGYWIDRLLQNYVDLLSYS